MGGSTSGNPFNKEYAFDAGKRALQDYILRNNIKGVKVAQMEDPGYYRIRCGRKGKLSLSMVVDGTITNDGSDYYLVLDENMKISSSDIDKMLKRAYFTGADIVVPKIIKTEDTSITAGHIQEMDTHHPLKEKESGTRDSQILAYLIWMLILFRRKVFL